MLWWYLKPLFRGKASVPCLSFCPNWHKVRCSVFHCILWCPPPSRWHMLRSTYFHLGFRLQSMLISSASFSELEPGCLSWNPLTLSSPLKHTEGSDDSSPFQDCWKIMSCFGTLVTMDNLFSNLCITFIPLGHIKQFTRHHFSRKIPGTVLFSECPNF